MTSNDAELPHVIGKNVNKLRTGYTLEDVALAGQEYGASWSSGSISAIEQGRFKATIETLALLSLALTDLRGKDKSPVAINDLLATDSPVEISSTNEVAPDDLLEWLAGGTLPTSLSRRAWMKIQKKVNAEVERVKGLHFPPGWVINTGRGGPLTTGEKRLAARAEIDPYELRAWSLHLWAQTLEDRRDELAGSGASPQKKGRVSRTLLDEIVEAMKANLNGDD